MKLKKIILCLTSLVLVILLASCQTNEDTDIESNSTDSSSSNNGQNGNSGTSQANASLVFSGMECEISDTSAIIQEGKIYKIVRPGTYTISGTLDDGQIQVEVQKTEAVTLVLDNFTGSCSDSAVIYIISADKVDIDLQNDSVNTLTDASVYVFPDPTTDKPNACIYSSDDLTIKGGGSLIVNANYNNGIGCKNDVEIKNGKVTVSAVNNAIKGNDSVTVCGDAEVIIEAADDGLKADTIDRSDKGFVRITEQAKVTVSCTDDAIQATQNVTVTSGATVTIKSASQAVNCDGTVNVDDGCIVNQTP